MVASEDAAILVSRDAGERSVHHSLLAVHDVVPGRFCNTLLVTCHRHRIIGRESQHN